MSARALIVALLAGACAAPPPPAPRDATVAIDTRDPSDSPDASQLPSADALADSPFDASEPSDTSELSDASPDTAPDALPDASADALPDALPDASTDALPSCDLGLDAPLARATDRGFLRFVNLARGVGAVRFLARNQPLYVRAHAEAVVPEGASSPHLAAVPISYTVDVETAADAGASHLVWSPDAGPIPPAATQSCLDPGATGTLARPLCADVYLGGSCTVVLTGTPSAGLTLWRIADVVARGDDCESALVRAVNASAASVDVDAPGVPIARTLAPRELSGARRVSAGAVRVTVGDGDGGAAFAIEGALTATHRHSVFVGDGARGLVLDDVPPDLW